MFIWELAKDLKEAKDLAEAGFGYDDFKSCKKAWETVEDSYYRSQLKIFKVQI